MTKLFASLRFACLAALSVTTLASCELYFGEAEGGGGSNGGGEGFSCTENADCAAGCYCDGATCQEAGFCASDEDCPEGYVCDEARSSCEPANCEANADCDPGSICQDGTCTATCSCDTDQSAVDQGFGYCDETTSTCFPGTDPAGGCAGELTCNEKAPKCDEGTVPLIADGCYTGLCRAIAQCGVAIACEAYQFATDCGNATCTIVSRGNNCTTPTGQACLPGDANCTCESFTFDSCETPAGGPVPEN